MKEKVWKGSETVDHVACKYWCALQGSGVKPTFSHCRWYEFHPRIITINPAMAQMLTTSIITLQWACTCSTYISHNLYHWKERNTEQTADKNTSVPVFCFVLLHFQIHKHCFHSRLIFKIHAHVFGLFNLQVLLCIHCNTSACSA